MSDPLRLLYLHKALAEFTRSFSFTLRLDEATKRMALKTKSPVSWLQKRLHRELREALGYPVNFYIVGEDDGEKRSFHVHGEVGLVADDAFNPKTLKHVRRAFRLAGGEFETGRQHQCRLRADPDEGWASYCAKSFWKASPVTRLLLERTGARWRIAFPGPVLSSNLELIRLAKELYERDRSRVRSLRSPRCRVRSVYRNGY